MSNRLIKSRNKRDITLEVLEAYYDTPLRHVSQKVGLSITMLKKICRSYGIQRWPHRQIRSINRSIAKICQHSETDFHQKPEEVQEQIKRLENKKRLIICGASSGLQSNVRNAIFQAGAEELANGYSSSDNSEGEGSLTPAPPTNASRNDSCMVGNEISKNAVRKVLTQLEKRVEVKALKNSGKRNHKGSGGKNLAELSKATFNNNCDSTPPFTPDYRFVMKKSHQGNEEHLGVPEWHPQARIKTVKPEHLPVCHPVATSHDFPGLHLIQNNCHEEELRKNIDMHGVMHTLSTSSSSNPPPGMLMNSSILVDHGHENFTHSNDTWEPPVSTYSLMSSPRFLFDISNFKEPLAYKTKQVEIVEPDSEYEEEVELLQGQVDMCTPHRTWGGECMSNDKTAHMNAEDHIMVPSAIAIKAASSSSYTNHSQNMTSMEDVIPDLQLPSPNTFNEQYSPWNFTASVKGKKKGSLDKAVGIIEDYKTPNQGRGEGIQYKYDTVQRGGLSQFWETESPSSNFTSEMGLVS